MAYTPIPVQRRIARFSKNIPLVALAYTCQVLDLTVTQYHKGTVTMTQLLPRAAISILFALMPATAVWSQTTGKASEQLGKVEFQNSCSPAVQDKFLRGVAMLHSFWYSAASATFEQVAAEDPSCAIAAWGFASILMSNPIAGQGASPKDASRAQAAIEKGRGMGAKTQRERDYIAALCQAPAGTCA